MAVSIDCFVNPFMVLLLRLSLSTVVLNSRDR